jgi:hypothetical protein
MAFLNKGLGYGDLPPVLDIMTALATLETTGRPELTDSTKAMLSLALLQTTDDQILKKAVNTLESRFGETLGSVMKCNSASLIHIWSNVLPNVVPHKMLMQHIKFPSVTLWMDCADVLVSILKKSNPKDILVSVFADHYNLSQMEKFLSNISLDDLEEISLPILYKIALERKWKFVPGSAIMKTLTAYGKTLSSETPKEVAKSPFDFKLKIPVPPGHCAGCQHHVPESRSDSIP